MKRPSSTPSLEEVRGIIRDRVVGKIQPRHDEHGHHYLLPNGAVVDSVTQVISIPKPHLLKWYGRKAIEYMEPLWSMITPENKNQIYSQASLAGEGIRDQAGDTGSSSHDAIEIAINEWIHEGAAPSVSWGTFVKPDQYGNVNPASVAGARSAQKFFKDHPFYIPVAAELLVGDVKVGSAGTCDVILYDTWTGKLIIGDWKTSNSIDEAGYAQQVATYRALFEKMTGLKTASYCLIMMLSKKYDKYDTYIVKSPAKAFAAFKHSLAQYNWINDGTPKAVVSKRVIKV